MQNSDMNELKKGKFISIEGIEGVGKSTNLAFIQQLLEDYDINVVTTREPGGTDVSEKIRQILLESSHDQLTDHTELLLIFAARAQHVEQLVRPALLRGDWVLCDRFTDASYAYQGGGRNVEISTIEWLEEQIVGNLRPDLTLLLDAPIEIGMERMNDRGELDRFELEEDSFFGRVRAAYLWRAEKYPQRIKLINADQPIANVQTDIRTEVLQVLS